MSEETAGFTFADGTGYIVTKFPHRKRPALYRQDAPNTLTRVATFVSDQAAEEFKAALGNVLTTAGARERER